VPPDIFSNEGHRLQSDDQAWQMDQYTMSSNNQRIRGDRSQESAASLPVTAAKEG